MKVISESGIDFSDCCNWHDAVCGVLLYILLFKSCLVKSNSRNVCVMMVLQCYSICGMKKSKCEKRFEKCMKDKCESATTDESKEKCNSFSTLFNFGSKVRFFFLSLFSVLFFFCSVFFSVLFFFFFLSAHCSLWYCGCITVYR